MKKNVLLQCKQGSAEQVATHAAWQGSRGRNPSMSFVGERNPRKALSLAMSIIESAKRTKLIDLIGEIVVQRKTYEDMTDVEVKAAARHIISTSNSENEVRRRIQDELGYPHDIDLHTTIPDDATGREARELVRGLGGLVMKNGAMAMAMMPGHNGIIFL